jgi:hypothetical protein
MSLLQLLRFGVFDEITNGTLRQIAASLDEAHESVQSVTRGQH